MTVDAALGSFTLRNSSGGTLTGAVQPGTVFEIRTSLGSSYYPYTSMLLEVSDPVLYFTIPDIFVGASGGSTALTLADLNITRGASIAGYDLGRVVITNLGYARADSGFENCYVIRVDFPGLTLPPYATVSSPLTVGVKLKLSDGYDG